MSMADVSFGRLHTSHRQLIVLGALWLLLAAIIAVTQFLQPVPITIEWRTETEVDSAGFNLYRAQSIDGPYSKVNENLIAGKGSATSGATYIYEDDAIRPGQTYFYQLEDVEVDNSVERHPPIQHTAPTSPWWMPLIVAASALTGLFFLFRGWRSERIS